jgi:hypothetical protein
LPGGIRHEAGFWRVVEAHQIRLNFEEMNCKKRPTKQPPRNSDLTPPLYVVGLPFLGAADTAGVNTIAI